MTLTLIALSLSHLVVTAPAVAVGITGKVEQATATVRTPVARFDTIGEGARIITHEGATAQLRLASGSLLRIGPNSEIALTKLEHSTPAGKRKEGLRVVAGRIWAQVTGLFGDSSFDVETATAVAGVRGTSLVVEVVNNKGRFVLLKGAMDLLREGAKVRLDQPGAFAEADAAGIGTPGILDPAALADLQRQVGGAGGALVSALVRQQHGASAVRGGAGGRSASRSDINGPNQLVDSPTAGTPVIQTPPSAPPANPSSITIVVTLPPTGT